MFFLTLFRSKFVFIIGGGNIPMQENLDSRVILHKQSFPKRDLFCFTNDNGETDTIPGTLRYFATIGERFVAM